MRHDPKSFVAAPLNIFDVEPDMQERLGGKPRQATHNECEAYLRGLGLRAGLLPLPDFKLISGGYRKGIHEPARGGSFGSTRNGAWEAGSFSVPMPRLRSDVVELCELDEAGEIVRTQALPIDPKKGGVVWKADHVRKVAAIVPAKAARKPVKRIAEPVPPALPIVRPCACVELHANRSAMSPSELVRFVRVDVLNLDHKGFADFLRLKNGWRTVYRWEAGDTEPLGPVVMLLEAIRDGWRPK